MCQPDWYYYKEQKVWKKVNACVKGETFCSKGTTTDSGGPENQLAHDRCTAYGECGYDDENKKCVATAEGCAQSKYCSEVDKFGVLKAACCPNKETGKCNPASSTSGIGKNFEFTCPPDPLDITMEEFIASGKCTNNGDCMDDHFCNNGVCEISPSAIAAAQSQTTQTATGDKQINSGITIPIFDLSYEIASYMIGKLREAANGYGTDKAKFYYSGMTPEQQDLIKFKWKACTGKAGEYLSNKEIKKCRANLMPKLLTKCSPVHDAGWMSHSFPIQIFKECDEKGCRKSPEAEMELAQAEPMNLCAGSPGFWEEQDWIKEFLNWIKESSYKPVKCSDAIAAAWCHPDDPKVKEYEEAKKAGLPYY
jgi:hypothetical protein